MADENENEEFKKTLKMNNAIALRYAELAEAIADRAGGRDGALFMLKTARETMLMAPRAVRLSGGAPDLRLFEALASALQSLSVLIQKAGWSDTPLEQTARHCARLALGAALASGPSDDPDAKTRAEALLALRMARQVLLRTRLDVADAWAPGELRSACDQLTKLAELVENPDKS